MSLASVKRLLVGYRSHDSARASTDADDLEYDAEKGACDLSETSSNSDASTLLESSNRIEGSRSHVTARVISDAIIGLSDGLTVPFALTAGLSALGNNRVVVFAGLAELTAGAISMGLGGYLGARSEEQSYRATEIKAREMTASSPESIKATIEAVFETYSVPSNTLEDLSLHIQKSPKLADFLLQFHHRAEKPSSSRAVTCALTIALGYFLGGFLPLLPYFFVGSDDVNLALWISVVVMAVALFLFGYGKTIYVSASKGSERIREGLVGGLQMMLVGGMAAACAMGLVKLFDTLAGIQAS